MKLPLLLLSIGLFLVSCEEDDHRTGFTTVSGIISETDGIQTITIDIGQKATSDFVINYQVGGSASLDGDYKILTPTNLSMTLSPFTVQVNKGESKTTLSIQPIDDTHVESGDETVYIFITGSSNNHLNSSIRNVQYSLKITDNDLAPTNGLQVDLSWNLGDGVSIMVANFDLYLARNVKFNNSGQLTSFDVVEEPQSKELLGFENFVINDEISDETYYVIIRFVEGSLDADVFLEMSQGSQHGSASGHVSTNYVGRDVYYGPISKSGNNFSFR
jgi:hypothetical protein